MQSLAVFLLCSEQGRTNVAEVTARHVAIRKTRLKIIEDEYTPGMEDVSVIVYCHLPLNGYFELEEGRSVIRDTGPQIVRMSDIPLF